MNTTNGNLNWKDHGEVETPRLHTWRDEESGDLVKYLDSVTSLVLANRGADCGFNLYFQGEWNGEEAKQLGFRLTWDQLHGLGRLIQRGLDGYNQDNSRLEGGVYSYPAEGEETHSPSRTLYRIRPVRSVAECEVLKAGRFSILRLLQEIVNCLDFVCHGSTCEVAKAALVEMLTEMVRSVERCGPEAEADLYKMPKIASKKREQG